LFYDLQYKELADKYEVTADIDIANVLQTLKGPEPLPHKASEDGSVRLRSPFQPSPPLPEYISEAIQAGTKSSKLLVQKFMSVTHQANGHLEGSLNVREPTPVHSSRTSF